MLIAALSVLIRWALVPLFGYQTPYLTTYPSIMIISVILGGGPGVAASLTGIWATETWLVEPIGRFEIGWGDCARMAILFCPVVYLGYVGQRLRAARTRSEAESVRASDLRRTAETQMEFLQLVVDHLPVAVSVIRASDLQIQLVNPAYRGIAPGKQRMAGKTLNELWPETGRNLGLGLAISKSLVELHGGSIQAESQLRECWPARGPAKP